MQSNQFAVEAPERMVELLQESNLSKEAEEMIVNTFKSYQPFKVKKSFKDFKAINDIFRSSFQKKTSILLCLELLQKAEKINMISPKNIVEAISILSDDNNKVDLSFFQSLDKQTAVTIIEEINDPVSLSCIYNILSNSETPGCTEEQLYIMKKLLGLSLSEAQVSRILAISDDIVVHTIKTFFNYWRLPVLLNKLPEVWIQTKHLLFEEVKCYDYGSHFKECTIRHSLERTKKFVMLAKVEQEKHSVHKQQDLRTPIEKAFDRLDTLHSELKYENLSEQKIDIFAKSCYVNYNDEINKEEKNSTSLHSELPLLSNMESEYTISPLFNNKIINTNTQNTLTSLQLLQQPIEELKQVISNNKPLLDISNTQL